MYVIYYCIMLAVSTTRNAKLVVKFLRNRSPAAVAECVGAKKMTEMEVTSVVIPERESQ